MTAGEILADGGRTLDLRWWCRLSVVGGGMAMCYGGTAIEAVLAAASELERQGEDQLCNVTISCVTDAIRTGLLDRVHGPPAEPEPDTD